MPPLIPAILLLILSVPPLTDAQRRQLATAKDGQPVFDEAALYPLLENAQTWTPGEEAGAMVPDLAAIEKTPEAFRGQFFLLEGEFAGRPLLEGDKFGTLARPGPWSGKLQQWVLITDRKTDQVVVINLVNPPMTVKNPYYTGAKIRTVGRFYKVWLNTDRHGKPVSYLTFVGNSAKIIMDEGPDLGSTKPYLAVLGSVLILGVVFIFIRTRGKRAATQPLSDLWQRREDRRITDEAVAEESELVQPALPEDPTQALAELERRRANDENP
ncbi:MAG: hypothetical protein K8S99_05075 [Planctomycetes bacterium]|nr:hypothetical protein [Planctomycetota bacterium]